MGAAPERLQKLADKMTASTWHNGVTLSLFDRDTGKEVHIGSGEMDSRTPYFGMGITKLFVTAILLQLLEEGKINLDMPFVHYIGACDHCSEFHVRNGVDATERVTLRHLLSHTSGFGDFFFDRSQARGLKHDLAKGVDNSWNFNDVLLRSRSHGALHAPGETRRARYSDTNFHLLGRVIEEIDRTSFAEAVQKRIADRIGLHATYVYCDPSDRRPIDLMSRTERIHVPRTMASLQADGGIVTTARESMIFARAFFESYLFDKRILPRLYTWRPMVFPAEYGSGLMQVKVPWWMAVPYRLSYRIPSLLQTAPRLIGQMGLGGSVCFFAPDHGVYVAGTVNQLAAPACGLAFALRGVEDVVGTIRPAHLRDNRPAPLHGSHLAD